MSRKAASKTARTSKIDYARVRAIKPPPSQRERLEQMLASHPPLGRRARRDLLAGKSAKKPAGAADRAKQAAKLDRLLAQILRESAEYADHAGHVSLGAYQAHRRIRNLAKRARHVIESAAE